MKDIKQRVANGQIRINGEKITDLDTELSIQEGYWELGDFCYHSAHQLNRFSTELKLIGIRNLFGEEPTNIAGLDFLTGFSLIQLSKREEYVFINAN